MTDKQIIIDNIDVSGCSNLYDIEDCICIDNGIEEYCKDNPNCYYKQLKRKEQTLINIKELAGKMNEECFYTDFDCKDCDMKNGCTYFNKKQILQKISEANL